MNRTTQLVKDRATIRRLGECYSVELDADGLFAYSPPDLVAPREADPTARATLDLLAERWREMRKAPDLDAQHQCAEEVLADLAALAALSSADDPDGTMRQDRNRLLASVEYHRPRFLNCYACECGAEWEDTWTCECDDECPECGRSIAPESSTIRPPDGR